MTLKSIDYNAGTNLELMIYPAAIKDTRGLGEILARSFYDFPDYLKWIYPLLQFTISEDLRYRLRIASPAYCCLVASTVKHHKAPTIVGTAEITLKSPGLWFDDTQYPYISNLAVKENYRRQGIGSKILRQCEQIALDWGYQEIRLHVLNSNDSARQLYDYNGYQICEVESAWKQFCFDNSTRLLLKKQLHNS